MLEWQLSWPTLPAEYWVSQTLGQTNRNGNVCSEWVALRWKSDFKSCWEAKAQFQFQSHAKLDEFQNKYLHSHTRTHIHTLEQQPHTLSHTHTRTHSVDAPEQHSTHFLLAALQKLCKVVLETYYAISVWPRKSNGSAKRAGGGSGQAAEMPGPDKKATLTNGNIFVCPCRVLLSQSKSANFHLASAVISLNGVIGQTNKRNRRNEGAAKKPTKQSRSRRINEITHH